MPNCCQCNATIEEAVRFVTLADGRRLPVCCRGCEQAASGLVEAALQPVFDTPGEDIEPRWQRYDLPALQKQVTRSGDTAGEKEVSLFVEAIHCASCSLLIERELKALDGVRDLDVNVTARRVRVRWDPRRQALSRILQRMSNIGFSAEPQSPGADTSTKENRAALKRLLVAGLGMMQVMMYAVGLYAGAFQDMEPTTRHFLHVVSMLVATPVVLYAGRPFFAGAWRDLRNGQAGMDVPVALAVGIAYAASVWAVFSQSGTVYFDSATMFVFFLSLGRFAEMKARHRAGAATEAFSRLSPLTATRLNGETDEVVAVEDLRCDDRLRIKPGETVPIDCRIVRGRTRVDESLLTGESDPQPRHEGDALIGGSINVNGVLEARVERTGEDTVLSHIGRLLQHAQSEKPRLNRLADTVARYFVSAVIIVAALVGAVWWMVQPGRALEVVLAVLVVTCPCALSLATPAALTAAIGRLARNGLLVTRANAIEQLAGADYALFDKTGTLTYGRLLVRDIDIRADYSVDDCMAIAAALERGSEHPIARAFAGNESLAAAEKLYYMPGMGLEGIVRTARGTGKYRIGRGDFVAALSHGHRPPDVGDNREPGTSFITMGNEKGVIARFELADVPRPAMGTVCAQLKSLGLRVEILSGDQHETVRQLGGRLGVGGRGGMTPNDKLDYIRALQRNGQRVVMIGDGVNDAPVLTGADVSIAMSSGTSLAQASADMVITQETLTQLPKAVLLCRRALRIIRQNIAWAVAYNAVALPLAALGLVAPWVAAIGMSASSLIVVLNALRLNGPGGDRRPERSPRVLETAGDSG